MNEGKLKALQSLKTSKGQIEGIIKMIEEGRYCVDISNQIIAAQSLLKKAGYKGSEEQVTLDKDKERKEREIKALLNRFIISAIFAVPLLILAMGPMIVEKLGLTLLPLISPMVHPKIFAVIQLLLVIPIIITGRKYYIIGFKSLFRMSPNMDILLLWAHRQLSFMDYLRFTKYLWAMLTMNYILNLREFY